MSVVTFCMDSTHKTCKSFIRLIDDDAYSLLVSDHRSVAGKIIVPFTYMTTDSNAFRDLADVCVRHPKMKFNIH